MDKYQIGMNAGIVWNKAATGLTDRDLNAAIGWLAREDKIDFDISDQHDTLFLNVNVYIG